MAVDMANMLGAYVVPVLRTDLRQNRFAAAGGLGSQGTIGTTTANC